MGATLSGIGALASGSSNVVGGITGIRQNSYNAHLQEEQAELNRQFNAQEAEKSRAWSTNERLAQQVYNTGEREATQDYNTSERLATQNYNSPGEYAKRLRAAGINPAVYFSGSGPSAVASSPQSSTPASSSVPSPVQASFAGGISPVVANIPQLMSGAGDMIRALTDANVGHHSISLIDANVEKALSDVYTNQQIAQAKELENQLNRANLPNNIRKAILEVSALAAQIGLTHNESEKAKAQKRLIELQSKTESKIADLKGTESLTAALYLKKAPRLWESEIRSNEAGARASEASAANIELFNKLHSDKRYQHSYLAQAVDSARSIAKANKISDATLVRIEEEIEAAVYANDNKEFTYWTDRLNKTIETVGSAASQFYGAGALRELIHLRRAAQGHTPIKGFGQ